jgi:hypothetical protein
VSFVLDNSVTMRWFFGDGKPQELAYAGKVFDAMAKQRAKVSGIRGQRCQAFVLTYCWNCLANRDSAFTSRLAA